MNVLDYVLIALLIIYVISGLFHGLVYGISSAVGLIIGLTVGFLIVPRILIHIAPSEFVSTLAVLIVVALAAVGGMLGGALGRRVRKKLSVTPVRLIDSLGGAAFAFFATLIVIWALGYAASTAQIPIVSSQARNSYVVEVIDGYMPDGSNRAVRTFAGLLDSSLFPRYIDPFADEIIVEVDAPNQGILNDVDVVQASESVVRITGEAPSCRRVLEGSGFIYGPVRVMTNAHVVAGVTDPIVEWHGERLRAQTVMFDPDLDIAILAVPELDGAALSFDYGTEAGNDVAIMGFPKGGPFNQQAARIRSEDRLQSPNIYDTGSVKRQVFALRGLVRSGNSGGPIVTDNGEVAGMVFAASVNDDQTGYALTAQQVRENAHQGLTASTPVSTGGCA